VSTHGARGEVGEREREREIADIRERCEWHDRFPREGCTVACDDRRILLAEIDRLASIVRGASVTQGQIAIEGWADAYDLRRLVEGGDNEVTVMKDPPPGESGHPDHEVRVTITYVAPEWAAPETLEESK
jgi:LmbE family N-acetylglucosaminyl deacetylase